MEFTTQSFAQATPRFHPYGQKAGRGGRGGRGAARGAARGFAPRGGRGKAMRGGGRGFQQQQYGQVVPFQQYQQLAIEGVNYKGQINEWFQKQGYASGPPFETVQLPQGGFGATLVLPIQGGHLGSVAEGIGANKKDASNQCAQAAWAMLESLGLAQVAVGGGAGGKAPKGAQKAKKQKPAVSATQMAAMQADGSFDVLKAQIAGLVAANPGKRASVYTVMMPAGEKRNRVQAALYKLLEEGSLANTSPTGGNKTAPFWHPVGYTGEMGGTVSDEQMGQGRDPFPMTEAKMVIFDVLSQAPGATAFDILNACKHAGKQIGTNANPQHQKKVIQAGLYQMEKEGTAAKSFAEAAPGAKGQMTWTVVQQ